MQSRTEASQKTGVLWITVYSGSGKTTVGRKVVTSLNESGIHSILLDGDELRSIFAGKWGYGREERVDLARVYFRLCSHLASQGLTVVISAVAMYDEVRQWVQTFIPNSVEVYLQVPEVERRRRDQHSKHVYDSGTDFSELYDEPTSPDLIIDNFGSVSPENAAEKVVRYYQLPREGLIDKGKNAHWVNYYTNNTDSIEPSPFAQVVSSTLEEISNILEIGCGNGRDAAYFATQGHNVVALDTSETAIQLCREIHKELSITFLAKPISEYKPKQSTLYDHIYSRFVLHAMTLDEEYDFLAASAQLLKPGGKFFIECRSIKDRMARKGDVISPTERIFGHYRRFIILEELLVRVREAGFVNITVEETKGLAVFGDEDPIIIRLVGEKRE